MKDVYRYGGAGTGLVGALLLNRLLGNTSIKSNILSAIIGAGAGYGIGGYLYNRFLNKDDVVKSFTDLAYTNPGHRPYYDNNAKKFKAVAPDKLEDDTINFVSKFKGDDKSLADAYKAYSAAKYGNEDGLYTSDQIIDLRKTIQQAKLIDNFTKELRKNPNSVVTDAPLAWLGSNENEHNAKLDKLDEAVRLNHKARHWNNGGYLGTGLSEADFNKAYKASGMSGASGDPAKDKQRFAAVVNYSRLSKGAANDSTFATLANNGKPLTDEMVDYVAYHSLPREYRELIPVGHRMTALMRAKQTNGWAREIDYNMWVDPSYQKQAGGLADWSDRAASLAYGAVVLRTGGAGWVQIPLLTHGAATLAIANTMPRYNSAIHERPTDLTNILDMKGLYNRYRHEAVRQLFDPALSPQYSKFTDRIVNANATDILDTALDITDLSLDSINYLKGRLSLPSYLIQTGMNTGLGILPSKDRIAARSSFTPGKPINPSDPDYNNMMDSYYKLWINQFGRNTNPY